MPRYDYKCKQCSSNFFIVCGINDSRENVACTDCGSTDIARKFKPVILKGTRARGYQDESSVVKPAENEPKTQGESKEEKQPVEVKDTKQPEISQAPASHDHCSPELDYQ